MDTLGDRLRAERERLGMSESELAAALNMKIQILEDLESNDYHRLAAAIYGKGFIRLYAEYVNLEVEPLLKEFTERYKEQIGSSTPSLDKPAPRRVRKVERDGESTAADGAQRVGGALGGWFSGLRAAVREVATGQRMTELAARLRLQQFLEHDPWTRIALGVCVILLLVLVVSGISQWVRRGIGGGEQERNVREQIELTHDVPEPYLE